jgi:uncharacterized membrane protein
MQLFYPVLHIAATCTSLGGLFYARMVLIPNLQYVPEPARETYLAKMIKRYGYIKWTGVTIITITGILQWLDIYPQVSNKENYLLAFVLKMAGAVGLFLITFLLALPNAKLGRMQKHRAFWSGINIICGLTILIGAALMRAIRNGEF